MKGQIWVFPAQIFWLLLISGLWSLHKYFFDEVLES